jgi:BMFP domain-containing protein YqiC
MSQRPRFFDDLAGVAGGAMSALTGLKDEAESAFRARVEETIRRLDLVRREEFDAVRELAERARAGQESAEASVKTLLARVDALEGRIADLESRPVIGAPPTTTLGGPPMIA